MSPLTIGGGSKSGSYVPGVYVDKATIVSVVDMSGKPLPFDKHRADLAIQLELEIGRSWKPIVTIAGDFKRDAGRKIVGWGKAYKIAAFLKGFGIEGALDSSNRLPIDMIKKLEGQECWRLSYCKGLRKDNPEKLSYANYGTILPGVEGNDARLLALFQDAVKHGRIKNYVDPSSLTQASTSFSFPSSETNKSMVQGPEEPTADVRPVASPDEDPF